MTFEEYEAAAAKTTNAKLADKDRLLDSAMGLAEEAGEVLALIRKHAFQSRDLPRDRLEEEIGDALWCVAMTARHAGMTLEQVAAANIAKLQLRHPGLGTRH